MMTNANAAPKFTKGQAVTVLSSWDNAGTFRVRDLFVFSAGKKQMILCDEKGVKFTGRFFEPTVQQSGHLYGAVACEVHPRMTEAEAEARGLELGAAVIVCAHDHVNDRIAKWGHDADYRKSMEESRAEILSQPRVVRQ